MKPSGFGLGGTYFITDAGIGGWVACARAEAGSRTSNASVRRSVEESFMGRDYRSAAGVVQFPAPPMPKYLRHFVVKHVTGAGTFRFQQHLLHLADALVDQWIGPEERDDGVSSIQFDTVVLATLDERDFLIRG
jgi:hypothetical protein